MVEACWLYSLADAQRHTDVAVHHSVLNLTHHHTNATPSQANFPDFTRRYHRDLSCSLNTLLSAERYDAPRELFDDRQAHCMRLLDAEAQASHLVYEQVNPVAAGLVAHPDHMPMQRLDFGLWKRGYIEVRRPPIYFGKDRPETLELRLSPPPLLYRAFGGDLDALIYHLAKLTDEAVRVLRQASKREPLGARALRRMHPWAEPKTLRETSGGRLVPTFRIGARGLTGKISRIEAALDVRRFRRESRDAFHARRDGDTEHRFPFGSYAARVYQGAPVADEPYYDAVVTRPGPLLDEVKRELEQMTGAPRHHAELVEEVRAAFADEANEIVEIEAVEPPSTRAPLRRSERDVDATEDEDPTERTPVQVRHRFDPRPEQRPNAARIVTLRDRRRGRPPGTRHGNDPPA
jgi:hypothetical protein